MLTDFDEHATTVTDLVEAQVARTPDAAAVAAGEGSLSYRDLDQRANRLGHYLQALGVGPDMTVAVFADRSLELTVALLAILKAGGACVPIDPSTPRARVDYMLGDSGARVVLTQERLAARLPPGPERVVVFLDCDGGERAGQPDTAPQPGPGADDLAYVIYTSGSTGQPKGVMLEHRGLVNHHRAVSRLYQLGPDDRVLQFCSLNFDVSVEEIFPTWASGATLVLRDDAIPILGRPWLQWLRRSRITMLNLPTAFWHEWVRDLYALGEKVPEDVRLVTVGGEKALGRAYATWRRVGGDRIRWINAYGPTEATIMATFFEPVVSGVPDGSWEDPPIGRPLANTTVLVLDDAGSPVPSGYAGQLHLGGPGLARGYLNQPALTAERFIDHAGARLYRTGDMVRARPDGNLEFIGRLDRQVKIRGFRIECGEVEAALMAHPDVADAAVVAREDIPGERRLVGYAVPAQGAAIAGSALRRFLSDRLPGYMVPSAVIVLAGFPTTSNGKVDRDALPAPDSGTRRLDAAVAPSTPTEEVLATIWAQVLGQATVGVEDDFFDSGGHSLMATQIIAQAREAFGVELPLHAIFETPTVRALATLLDRQGADPSAVPPLLAQPRAPGSNIPLSLAQEQMWALEVQATPRGLYNVTIQHRYHEAVDGEVLRRAVDRLVARHESLRTAFTGDPGRISQTVAQPTSAEVAITDLRSIPEGERGRRLVRCIAEQDAEPFELGRAPLFRTRLYRVGDDDSVLAATFDHMIVDGTSTYIFMTELNEVYHALIRGRAPELPPLRVQFADFSLWQHRWLTDERQQAHLDYWKQKLHDMPRGPAVPVDGTPVTPTRRIASRPLVLPAGTYTGLKAAARSTRSTMFMLATAGFEAVLAAMGGASDIVLSTTLSGRQRGELEGIIGFFAGIGRIRTDLAGASTFEQIVERTRDSVLGLFEHQDVPFMRVRKALFPGPHPPSTLPIEFQYFHARPDRWAPGVAVVERPGPERGPDELFFRGQLHPLSVTLLDDGGQLWGEVNYKVDFYAEPTIERLAQGLEQVLEAVASRPTLRVPDIAGIVQAIDAGRSRRPHQPVGTWHLEASAEEPLPTAGPRLRRQPS